MCRFLLWVSRRVKAWGADSEVEIVDAAENPEYEGYLFRRLFHSKKDTYGNHFRRRRSAFYDHRREYLKRAIPEGFHKKILIFEGDQMGTIEYAPAEGSGLPISGDNVVVMNCVWVHRKAQGHSFGKRLLKAMMETERAASGFATLAMENYWGPYFKKSEMESLGFESVKSVRVRHKIKNRERCFELHLMWLPIIKGSKPPTWDESKLLQGVYFCRGHSLFHDRHLMPHQRLKLKEVLEKC